ncbi:MAG TPA: hypothetical protein VFV81_05670, partial [Verrucomicrobiae bacterium]|nr:hypothetical protein [Verrucomicrobiae bacterium]
MKLNFLKFLVVTAALSLAGSAQNAQALNLSYLRARWHAFLSHNNNSTGTSTTTAGTAIGSSDTNSVGVTTNQVATTNMVAPQNVTTQSVTSAGNNAVNGAPGSFGITGVGVTTPANSVTTSQSGSGNVSAGTNGVSANTGATTNSTASAKTGSGLSGNSMIAAEKNRTQTTSLAQRLINAGSISRGSGSATSASSADSNPNSVSASGTNSNLTQNIHFDLTFYEAASNRVGNDIVTPVAVTDGDIIAALGNATGNQFSGGAQLILATDATLTNSPGVIEVLDGS